MSSGALARVAGPATVFGGLLWVPYGVFAMLEPWSVAKVYQEDVRYSVIVDAPRFVTYSLPGTLALLLTVGARRPQPGGCGGAVRSSDPVFTAARVFGTVALGAAAVLASLGARRAGVGSGWMLALLALGLLGLFLLPLWPLVYAMELVPEGVGAAVIALFGLGWVGLGTALIRRGRIEGDARSPAHSGQA